jgi:hypothetical protein
VVDAARTRLAIGGARAVEELILALESDSPRIRLHAIGLLALIQDTRARGPLLAMLFDRDARMRETAARALGRFPSPEAVAALERLLRREKHAEVRVAAVQALLEQYAGGQDQALCQVLALLLDPAEETRARLASLGLIRLLRPSERRAILKRLRSDPSAAVSHKAAELEGAGEAPAAKGSAAIRELLADLAAEDYAVWNEAVQRLASHGGSVVDSIVSEMRRRDHDPEFCARAAMVLKALGPRRGRALADAVDHVDEPLPLLTLVEVIGALGEKSLIYRLRELIERIAARAPDRVQGNGFDPMQRVRARAHLELARVGSRVAIGDLRELLRDPDRRLEAEALAAVEMIGKKDEIPDLVCAGAREDRITRKRLAGVVRTIMHRERIRKNSVSFQGLDTASRRVLEAMLAQKASRRSGGSRKDSTRS